MHQTWQQMQNHRMHRTARKGPSTATVTILFCGQVACHRARAGPQQPGHSHRPPLAHGLPSVFCTFQTVMRSSPTVEPRLQQLQQLQLTSTSSTYPVQARVTARRRRVPPPLRAQGLCLARAIKGMTRQAGRRAAAATARDEGISGHRDVAARCEDEACRQRRSSQSPAGPCPRALPPASHAAAASLGLVCLAPPHHATVCLGPPALGPRSLDLTPKADCTP